MYVHFNVDVVERQALEDPITSFQPGGPNIPFTQSSITPTTTSISLTSSSNSPTPSTSTISTSSTTFSSISPTASTQVFTSVFEDVTSTSPPVATASSTTTPSVATASPATTLVAMKPKAFLQNKPLAGAIFTVAGIVTLVIIVIISTFALRRSRRRRLQEGLSFDPNPSVDAYDGTGAREGSLGKNNNNLRAVGSESSLIRHPNYAQSPTINIPFHTVVHSQHGFYGQGQNQGYNQPYAVYNVAHNMRHTSYGSPRSPDPMYDSNGQTSRYPMSDPYVNRALPSFSAQNQTAGLTKRVSSQPGNLGHSMQQLTAVVPLPDMFGIDDAASRRGSVDSDEQFSARTLKIANE